MCQVLCRANGKDSEHHGLKGNQKQKMDGRDAPDHAGHGEGDLGGDDEPPRQKMGRTTNSGVKRWLKWFGEMRKDVVELRA